MSYYDCRVGSYLTSKKIKTKLVSVSPLMEYLVALLSHTSALNGNLRIHARVVCLHSIPPRSWKRFLLRITQAPRNLGGRATTKMLWF